MSGRYLLDTNIIIALFKKEISVDSEDRSKTVLVPSISLGELFYGAYKSAQKDRNISLIEEFMAKSEILSCDATTARHYGRIKKDLQTKGKPLPENDVWIAALAFQHELILATRDAHFQEIEAIRLESW